MSFVLVAILSYFLTASATVLDKFLIASKKIEHPAVYTFFVGLLSIFSLIFFFPFGFHWVAFPIIIGMLFFGMVYTFGLLSLFFTFQRSEASRVVPVVGVVTSLTSFAVSVLFFGDGLGITKIWGIFFLILGGVLISLKFSRKEATKIFSDFPLAALAGFFLGVAFSSFKHFYNSDSFINVFIWTRIGAFLGALSLFLLPSWRRKIVASLRGFGADKRGNTKTGVIFIFNKILGGLGSIIFNFSISMGNVAVVNSLVATEYVFVFGLGMIFSRKSTSIFQEEKKVSVVFQKLVAIIIIGVGVLMVK